VTVSEECAIAIGILAFEKGTVDDSARSVRNLVDGLTVGHAIFPEIPTGTITANVGRRASFVVAVVPLTEVVIEDCRRTVAGQAAGLAGALQRTREDARKRPSMQILADGSRSLLPSLSQGEVGSSSVGS
jgi:hypothetical protein